MSSLGSHKHEEWMRIFIQIQIFFGAKLLIQLCWLNLLLSEVISFPLLLTGKGLASPFVLLAGSRYFSGWENLHDAPYLHIPLFAK